MSWRHMLHSVLASQSELDAGVQQQEARRHGSQAVAQCPLRTRVQLTGLIRAVTYAPADAAPELVAELFDGSGSVELIWLGRREIPGIEPGRRLSVAGTLTEGSIAGRARPVIYNPSYTLLAGQAA